MSNFEFPFKKEEKKPLTIHPEMKIRCLIIDIEKRLDKKQHDYGIIRTQLDQRTNKSYLAFSQDYILSAKAKSLLLNFPHMLVDNGAILTIKKKDDLEKVIEIHSEK